MQFEHATALKERPKYPFRLINSLAFKRREKGYHAPTHIRNDSQLYYCITNKIEVMLDNNWSVLEPGECVFIPPGIKRSFKGTGKEPQYLLVHFISEDDVFKDLYKKKQMLSLQGQAVANRLINELSGTASYESEQMVYALITELFIEVFRSSDVVRGHKQLPKDERVRLIERYMKLNFHRSLGRDEFGKAAALSPSHVGYLYQKVTGKTLISRLTEIRIEEAKRLLENSTLPITYIAHDVGFNSFSHFTQLFKKSVGFSPSEYRKSTV
jgi:AraC-like DNA-binding protein